MRGQIAIDVLFAVLFVLMMLGIYTAFVDRGSVEARKGLQYVTCDLAGTKLARAESLLRLSGMGHAPGETNTFQLTSGGDNVSPIKITVKYNYNNVEVNVTYTGTKIVCLGRAVPKWQ